MDINKVLMILLLFSVSPAARAADPTDHLVGEESEKSAPKVNVSLKPGMMKLFDLYFTAFAGPNGISYGNPKVATTTLIKIGTKQQLNIMALAPGFCTIHVRDNDGTLKMRFEVTVSPIENR